MNISTDKIYLLGLKNGLFSVITEFNEDDDVNSQIQSNSSLRNNFYYYENIALASIKKMVLVFLEYTFHLKKYLRLKAFFNQWNH